MHNNNTLTKINSGQKAYGFAMTSPSATLIELMGIAGFDFVHFDSEHGPFTPENIDDMCRVAELANLTPMARVPDIDHSTILRFLDRGIMGIMGPHITTKERAKTLADACRFAPRGKRSYGSSRGANYGRNNSTTEYMENFNSQVIVIAQLEDIEVLDNIDGILSVDGIDYYSSGAQDIAQSMNLPGQPNHPKVKEFELEVRNRVHTAGGKMVDEVIDLVRINEVIIDAAITHLSKAKSSK